MSKPAPASPSRLSSVVGGFSVGAIALLTLFAYATSYYGWRIYWELFSHFQVQYFAIALILFSILILLRRRSCILLGLFLCAVLAMQILPWYLPPLRLISAAASHGDVRLFIANLNARNQSYERVVEIAQAAAPDIIILMEVGQRWKERFDALSDQFPYSSAAANPDILGLLVYSRIPLTNTEIRAFVTENKRSVVTQITIQEQPITLIATHPFPPVKPSFFRSRNLQLDRIIQYLESVQTPVILAGDLNITMWSPYYRRLEHRTGLRNARKGFGILPTWPTPDTYTRIPGWLTSLFLIPIDHCLVSPDIRVTAIRTGADTDSDHRPLVVDLQIDA